MNTDQLVRASELAAAQLHGHSARVRQDLRVAYGSLPWNRGLIARLTGELGAIEREIAATMARNPVAGSRSNA